VKILRAIFTVFVLVVSVASYFGYIVLGMFAFTASGSRATVLIAALVVATVAMSAGLACLLEWQDRQ